MKPSELRCCINLIAMYGKWKSDIGCRRSIGDLMRFLDPIEGWNCCKSTWFDLQSLRAIDRRPVAWWTLGDPGMRHCHVGNGAPFFVVVVVVVVAAAAVSFFGDCWRYSRILGSSLKSCCGWFITTSCSWRWGIRERTLSRVAEEML